MAKKYQTKESALQESIPVPVQKAPFRFTASNVIPLAICLVYLGVHFIGNFDAYDAMGPQWLFLVLVDFLVIIFLLSRKNEYDLVTGALFKNIFSKLYLAFFVLAGLSTFTAINPTEAWVCYVRLIATIIAFFNISIVLNGRIDLFKWIAQLLGLILLVESISTLKEFLDGVGNLPMNQLILNLKGTTGNKNIFAADLVVKIPFVIYCLHTSRLWGRLLNIPILLLSTLTLFIVNARASYISLLLIVVFYIVYCILEYKKEKRSEQTLYRISYILIPIIAAFLISQIELTSVKNLEEGKGGYGTVTDRLGSIANISDEGNYVRIRLWLHAIDYTKHHPIIGCGYGNWKIASIPYQKAITNDLVVPVHSHNDFFETFAELGMPGGLLYLSLFICMLIFMIRVYKSNADEETKFMSFFSFLAFVGYSIDAFFNFPMERPISQILFALIVALQVTAYNKVYTENKQEATTSGKTSILKPVFGLTAILLLMPATYITYLTHKSLVAQRIIIPDMENEPMKLKWTEIFPLLPAIPNLSASAQPLEAIKGRYLNEAGKYPEALVLLNRAINANPVIGYSEFLKASVFYHMGNFDSASVNATKAFYTRPRARTYYQTLMAILAKTKDTIAMQKAFKEYNIYRSSPFGWNLYLTAMLNAKGKGTQSLLAVADSGLHIFPNDSLLTSRKAEILQFMERPAGVVAQAPVVDYAKAQIYYDAGIAAFNKARTVAPPANKEDYITAARNFAKAAEITPGNYVIYENAGVSYFNIGEYQKSIIYFNKVLAMKTSHDGKSEYFKGVALYNLGKKEEGCNLMRIASSKGYKEADAILKANCK